jgi:hypothetical protein
MCLGWTFGLLRYEVAKMSAKCAKDKDFLNLTNQDIYEQVMDLNRKMDHICLKIDSINGKIKFNQWLAGSAVSIAIFTLGILIEHILK